MTRLKTLRICKYDALNDHSTWFQYKFSQELMWGFCVVQEKILNFPTGFSQQHKHGMLILLRYLPVPKENTVIY